MLAAKKETRKIKGDICGKCLGLQIGDKQNLGDKILGKGKSNCDGQKEKTQRAYWHIGDTNIQTHRKSKLYMYVVLKIYK